MRRLVLASLLILSLLASACGSLGRDQAADGRLPVVATFSVIADLAQNVGGEHITITTLVGPGTDTHTFNPSPADGAALVNAQLIFEIGADFETWLDDLYGSAAARATRVVLSDDVTLHEAGPTGEDGEHADEAVHEHGERDPHIWHNVANAIIMVRNIRDALIKADPAHKADYEARAQAYTAELQALDAWVFEQAQTLPAERRVLVTTHDTFGYYAERYDFQVLGTVLPTTTEGASPSAQELAALVETVRAAGVPAVFAENVTSNSLINQVANEAGVRVVGSLFTDALGPAGSGGETFIGMLRQNTDAIVTALGG